MQFTKKAPKINYKKEAWKEYKKRNKTKEKFEEDWKNSLKYARKLYGGQKIRYSRLIKESITSNKDTELQEFENSLKFGISVKEFKKNHKVDFFVEEVRDRFEGFIKKLGNAKLVEEDEDAEVIYRLPKDISLKLEEEYGIENLLEYSINDLFEDYRSGLISYEELLKTIQYIKDTNIEYLKGFYSSGRD